MSVLWPGGGRAEPRVLVALYLGVPTVLTLLFGPRATVAEQVDAWVQNALVTVCIGGAVQGLYALALGWAARRERPLPLAARALGHAAVVLVGTVVGGELAARLLGFGWDLPVAPVREGLLRIGLVSSVVVSALVFGYERLRARIVAAELGEEHARRAALLAELRAIQARTQPHFLFNSLNVVAALVEEDPARAEQVLERLASLFRYALTAGATTWVPLRDELAAVHDYLVVEGTRFSDRLAWGLEVDGDLGELEVPPFIVQPLVENAVQHGIGSRVGPGRVTVRARRLDGRLSVEVEDDGVGLGRSDREGAGTALDDVRERLVLLYGADAAFTIGPRPDGGTVARLDLPARRSAS